MNLEEAYAVKRFANFMFRKFDLEAKDKEDSILMKIIAWFLNVTTIMKRKVFMKNYTTTMFGKVYLRYKIGDLQRHFKDQMAMIGHECTHRLQAKKNIPFFWRIYYLFSSKKRADYEMEGYATTMKTIYWLTGIKGNPVYYANKLKSYKCTKHVARAEKYLNKVIANIDNDSYHNKVDIAIREWIKYEM